MTRIRFGAALSLSLAMTIAPAFGQIYQDSAGSVVPGVVPVQPGVGPLFTNANPGHVSGSFSASLSGFQPTPAYASLNVGASSSRVGLPTGAVVIVYNTGANPAFVTLGNSSVVATSGNDVIPAGGWLAFTVGSNTFLAAIETAGATALNISGGSGLPTGAGAGGGGGSGSGGSTPQGTVTKDISVDTASTSVIIPGTAGQFTYISYMDLIASGTTSVTLEYGSGTNCGTGTTVIGGRYDLTAQTGKAAGAGLGPIGVIPAGDDVCLVNSAGIHVGGMETYTQSATPVASFGGGGGGGSGGSGGAQPQTTTSAAINISTATTTTLISGAAGEFTYVTGWDVITGGTGTFALEYGTQTTNPCDTGTTALTGAYPLTAQAGQAKSAAGSVFVVPVGKDVCAVTSAAIQYSGSIQYTQNAQAISSFGGAGGGAGAASVTPWQSNGSYINNSSVATSSTNAALTGSPAALLINNTGSFPIMVKLVSSGAGSVTLATSDDIVPVNSTHEIGTSNNGFLAYAAIGGTSAVQIAEGSGQFTGAGGGGSSGGSGSNASVGTNNTTGPGSSTQMGVLDGSGNLQPLGPSNPMPTAQPAIGTIGQAFPATPAGIGAESSGNMAALIQADHSVPISISTATTTQLVALSSGKGIYVTAWDVVAGGPGNFTLEYGTGSSCSTGTTALTGAYPLTAQTGVAKGSGFAPVLFVPAGNALCALTSAAVQMSGSVSYTQF